MQRWRYKVLVIREMALAEAKLNAEGEKGWELVGVCMSDSTTGRAFFKILDDGTLGEQHSVLHGDTQNAVDHALVSSH